MLYIFSRGKHPSFSLSGFFIVLLLSLLTGNQVLAQAVWLKPANAGPHDSVTLFFDASKGNKALENYAGDVYLHAGVITNKSLDVHSWKNVVGNWGKADPNVRMQRVGNNLYAFHFIIQKFYNLHKGEVVQQLTFVFRNANGSKVAKDANGNDFLIPVFGYKPPVKKKATYLFKSRKIIDYQIKNNILTLHTNHGSVKVSFYTPKMVEVKNFKGTPDVPDSSVAIILPPEAKTRLTDRGNHLILNSDSMQVVIDKNPERIRFVYHHDTLLKEARGYFQRSDNDGLQFKMTNGERFYGLGERAVNNLKGKRFELFNQAHYNYQIGEPNLNFSVPLLLSSHKYLLFFDNHEKGYADIGKSEKDRLEFGAIGGLMKYVFIAGYSYPDIYKSYGQLTGTQPLPPRWALGNLQSRMAYRTQKETDSIVNLMHEKRFPIDAIILDFYWFGDSIKGTMGRLAWYKPHWPHPKQMIAKFRREGVKTILITEPYILDTLKNFHIADSLHILATDSLGKTYVNHEFYFGPGALIDIFKPQARQWFWQQYRKQINIGVAGWWGDLGEPESHPFDQYCVNGSAWQIHNVYGFYWEKMIFDNYRKEYPQERVFDLNRAGYAGSQRWSVFPWSGDVARSWGGLQAQLPVMLHMSLSGMPFIHADAGGFAQGVRDDTLYTRWLQFACFSPILRPHGSGIPSEPVFFNDTTQRIVRFFMQERYRLLPYLYTATWEAHKNGTPLIRPLFFTWPEDTTAYSVMDEYLWGNDFLVAPVLHKTIKQKRVYLPKGTWYDWWTGRKYTGGQWVILPVHLQTIPVFVKAGSFIPMAKAVESTDDYSSENLTVRFYPAEEGTGSSGLMYEDDGKTFGAYERGAYELLQFENSDGTVFRFNRTGNGYKGMPEQRRVKLEIMTGIDPGKRVFTLTQNGKKFKVKWGNKQPQWHKHKRTLAPIAYYDKHKKCVVIDFVWTGKTVEIEMK
jgi:oligosaccharide 4-alpha-D-glucosyltransferase